MSAIETLPAQDQTGANCGLSLLDRFIMSFGSGGFCESIVSSRVDRSTNYMEGCLAFTIKIEPAPQVADVFLALRRI
jgi:hypothetical protein